jgi:hypothetical protein
MRPFVVWPVRHQRLLARSDLIRFTTGLRDDFHGLSRRGDGKFQIPRKCAVRSGRIPLMNDFAEAHLLFLVGAFAVLTIIAAITSSMELFPRRRASV